MVDTLRSHAQASLADYNVIRIPTARGTNRQGRAMRRWWPDDERGSTAVVLLIASALFAWRAQDSLLIGFSVFTVITAVGLWLRMRWADYLAFLFVLVVVSTGVFFAVTRGFTFRRVLVIACGIWFGRQCWKLIAKGPATTKDEPEDDEEEDRAMTSLVLLLSEPRYLEAPMLARILESAWGHAFHDPQQGEDEELTEWYVVGEPPMFIAATDNAYFMIHSHEEPYFDEVDEMLEQITELRIRKMLEKNTAWLSVDLLRHHDQDLPPESFYPQIGKAIAELAEGSQVLGIIHPATQRWNPWDESLLERLRSDDPLLSAVSEYSNVPVIQIESDDPRMQAAVAEARGRWPEFVKAYESRGEEDTFTVKAAVTRNDNTEFIWLDVIGLEPNYIHGTLANNPVDLGGLELGDRIEVPLTDLNDWAYGSPDGEINGLFTLKAIEAIQAARAQDADP